MKKILLTGSTGFIGRHVVNELHNKGYEVHALVRNVMKESMPHYIEHQMDIMDSQGLDQFFQNNPFDNLMHIAWFVGDKCHTSNTNIAWTIATLNLIQSFTKNGGKKILGAGTVSEYDFNYGYLRENETPLTAPTLYGQCKAAVYNTAKIFCKQSGVDFQWARIFNLYGPKEKESRLMPSVIKAMLKNGDVKVSDCLKIQDYLHVFDTAKGIVDLFESQVSGAVNICSGTPIRLRTIVEKIAELTDFKGKILWGAIPASFEAPFVVGANEILTKEVGWQQKISLEEGLKQTIAWWKENDI